MAFKRIAQYFTEAYIWITMLRVRRKEIVVSFGTDIYKITKRLNEKLFSIIYIIETNSIQ